ncbi:MAG: hypothetical protein GX100_08545 [candidate division WS1 bacterium]|nr:hypothetical protein [candidate division WS1 bacterium]
MEYPTGLLRKWLEREQTLSGTVRGTGETPVLPMRRRYNRVERWSYEVSEQ